MSSKIIELQNGVEGLFIKNDRFNTTLISYNFYMPLEKESIAHNALLPFILTSCSEKYPDFSKLNYKLSKLYGAKLNASTEKCGDYQLLRMAISVINDRFSFEENSLIKNASELLLSLIFEPKCIDGEFSITDLEREKRKAIEHINSEISEKRIFAKKRLIEEMFENDVFGLPKCGTVDDVKRITGKSLYSAWKNMLSSAFLRVQVVGSTIPDGLFDEISEKFSAIERKNITDCKKSSPTLKRTSPKIITDYFDVTQGKLCIGFSSEMFGSDDDTLPLAVMADIFGGGPYSRLFSNVREKMSLCYYCSAGAVRQKGIVIVESGVEAENCEKAKNEILNQLEIIKKGDFSDFEFESSIKSITDSLYSYNDSLNAIDLWYAIKINNDGVYSPEEIAERIGHITRDDVVGVANGISLNTVYKLLPREVLP